MSTKNIILIIVGLLFGYGIFFGPLNYNHMNNFIGSSNQMMGDDHGYDHDHDHNHNSDVMKEYEIYPSDVVKKIENKEDIVLLDVRTLEEYQEMHLKNATLLPVEELSQQSLDKIGLGLDSKDKEIILYCRSGARSKMAYDIMKSLGYTNIKSSQGGMMHWLEDKYPYTESGKK